MGDSKEKAIMGAAAPKPPLAIPPHSKLWGFLAFSREQSKSTGWPRGNYQLKHYFQERMDKEISQITPWTRYPRTSKSGCWVVRRL